ncbi:MAG: rod shape-determining protein [Clostridia bacterium]|nr:rod shape-determining protein [Clostridia bacterium]
MVGVKMGIDFGSSNLTVFAENKGIVVCEPSVMVCDVSSGEVLAWGSEAKQMCGKLPASMRVVRPIRDGVISDFDAAKMMLSRYIETIGNGRLFRPNVLMCVPDTVTEIAKKSLFNVVMSAGAARACFVSEALAAAVGAGVSLTEPKGTLICDIGGGTTDCAVITMGNIESAKAVNVGGDVLTQAIIDYVLRQYQIELGETEAENIKRTVGSAVPRKDEIALSVCGKNCDTGLPSLTEISSGEIYRLLKPYLDDILNCIRDVLEVTTPELCGDILDSGVLLTGGTANLYGLDQLIEQETGLKTVKTNEADRCAAFGLGRLLKDMKYLERIGYLFVDETAAEEEYGEGEG